MAKSPDHIDLDCPCGGKGKFRVPITYKQNPAPSGDFLGHEGRQCGDHRTVGGRSWCFGCTEWCYPDQPCAGCEIGLLRAEVARLSARPEFVIYGTWLCQKVDGCNCGFGGECGHEPRCELEPVVDLSTLDGFTDLRSAPPTDEQIDRAAEAVWTTGAHVREWPNVSPETQDYYRKFARAALTAARSGA